MRTYQSKPVRIVAVQLTRELIAECLLDGKELPMGLEFRGEVRPTMREYMGNFVAHSRQGEVGVSPDDWIIQEPGAPALCYPCKPDVFAEKYEAVDADPAPHGRDMGGAPPVDAATAR